MRDVCAQLGADLREFNGDFAGSSSGAPLEIIREYIENQKHANETAALRDAGG